MHVVDGGKKAGLLHTEAGQCAVAALAKDGRNRMVIVQNTVNVLASRRCFQLHVRRQPFAVVSSRHIPGQLAATKSSVIIERIPNAFKIFKVDLLSS